ncbi:MAG: VWA domain-containing protein [Vicinamibacterales bacterium]
MVRPRFLVAFTVTVALAQVGARIGAQAGPAQQPTTSTPPQPAQQATPDAGQQPTFRAGINFVRVDVIVTEKGEPVTDLTQADFEVREDGTPQAIEQFRLIKVDGNPRPGDPPPRQIRNRDDEEAEAARDDVRVIVIFLDDYHVRVGAAMSVKRPLIEFIQTQLRPTDMVAVMYPLTPVSGVEFTRNHASIISAVNNFEGRKFRYDPRNGFEQTYAQQPAEVVEQIRNQVVMGALRGIATRLGAVRDGRKSLIYVSEGLTAMLPPQLRTQNAELGIGGVRTGPMTGENNPREETARAFAQSDLYLWMREVTTAANRNNTSIYSLDPRGLATNEFGIDENVGPGQDRVSLQDTQNTLRVLSDDTDGKAVINRNDLVGGLAQVMRDSSFYYLIGYSSSGAPADGKFHEIKVNVKRRGIDVRARRGFWAATADDVLRARTPPPAVGGPPKALDAALASLATPVQSAQYLRTWLGTERGENGKTRVSLVWEPITGPANTRREQASRVSILAASASGDLIYRGRTTDPAALRLSFDAPPGPLELRLSVEAAGGGVLDNEVRKVTIPDLTSPQAAISTPRVFRARTARDVQALTQDGSAVPVTDRQFSRTERVLIRFYAYGAGTDMPSATAVLLNRTGARMADVPVAAATAGGTHQIDLGLASMPPGEYVVEITVVGASGEAKELVAIRVTS